MDIITEKLNKLQNSAGLVAKDKAECIATYSREIKSAWGDVLVISTALSVNNSYLGKRELLLSSQ